MSIKPIKKQLLFTTQLALWLKVPVYWVVLECSSFYQRKVIKAFNRYFQNLLNKIAIQKSD